MKRGSSLLLIILILLVFAAVMNPTREEFIDWGVNEIQNQAENDFTRVLGGAVAGPMLEMQTEAHDYVFFSTFSLQKADREITYLGVFNTFITFD
ncbi:hypothetical protein [Halanaerobium salsuginis]|jgi:hypothetical protein|uniref:DUF4359 domain-containing protein n=1 Tax=Halanaerobium salsuginis TaxID=29563 RepID=A0A1I4H8B4_9FIRM|nr:hypothetical protein [Halanaerobium salsuginis]SFL38528.1 hypothetical protein SAMN02983006_01009 [Halanaerobium salsuginis]